MLAEFMFWALSLGQAPPIAPEWTEPRVVAYHIETAVDAGGSVRRRFTLEQLLVLQKLNRADLRHLERLPVLVVPDVWVENELAYSPLPYRYTPGEGHPRLLVVHQPDQVFGAYEDGRLVRWGPVSTGRRTEPTPPGLFHLNWRKQEHTSSINPDWIMNWSFNFENQLGLAFHEQELPGRPASHACVRLLSRDAQWLFEWGEPWMVDATWTRVLRPGTPVFITGEYDFKAAPPWRSPDRLARPLELPPM
jgi:hypothetical protein